MEDFARYLAAKRTVDDRALNGRVWRRLSEELKSYPGAELALVDVGAGIGTGAERFAEWRLAEPLSRLRYTGLEPRKIEDGGDIQDSDQPISSDMGHPPEACSA